MKVRCYGGTDRGVVRPTNEDALLLAADIGLFVVCDGVGGRVAGDVASSSSVRVIETAVRGGLRRLAAADRSDEACAERPTQLHELLRASFQRANDELHAIGAEKPALRGLCTTASALLLDGAHALIAHVGDSRIYRLREHRIHQLTHDHTFAAWAVEGGISSASAARLSGLTEALGIRAEVRIDLSRVEVAPGDRFLLCTDGLHAHRGDDPALLDLLGGPAGEVIPRTIKLARARGCDDNVTAAVVICGD
jgi:protein phosphatase